MVKGLGTRVVGNGLLVVGNSTTHKQKENPRISAEVLNDPDQTVSRILSPSNPPKAEKGDDDHLSWRHVAMTLIASYQSLPRSPKAEGELLLLHRRGFTTDAVTDAGEA